MEPFKSFKSKAVPMLIDNIDTDVITPIGRIMQGGTALFEFAFEPLRFDPAGRLRADCPLNDRRYDDANILIAGDNFGCGSSRETAVWAVAGMGFLCVIAPSFGDIFYSNGFKNGLLPVILSMAEIAALAQYAEGGRNEIDVNLESQTIVAGDRSYTFDIPPLRKEALLLGLDDLGLIQRRMEAVFEFEKRDQELRPWVHYNPDTQPGQAGTKFGNN
jgi:3-isopropylmalate/(R)-2-methylmalate dehydratase small subunit